jgi:hypothetical protein
MKKIILLLIFGLSKSLVFAIGSNTSSFISKREIRKEKRMAETEKNVKMTKTLLRKRDFVLEADYLQNSFGRRHFVNSTLNFIAVDGTKAIIQTGRNTGMGYNTVGGVTAKGLISVWKLTENKEKKIFHLSFEVTTNIGIYDLQFMIAPTNDFTTAMLTGLKPRQLTFIGNNLVPYDKSSIFEGQTS